MRRDSLVQGVHQTHGVMCCEIGNSMFRTKARALAYDEANKIHSQKNQTLGSWCVSAAV